jgi:hypothetical protein
MTENTSKEERLNNLLDQVQKNTVGLLIELRSKSKGELCMELMKYGSCIGILTEMNSTKESLELSRQLQKFVSAVAQEFIEENL